MGTTAHARQDRAERDAGKNSARESGVTAASAEALAALATRFHQVLAELVEDPSKRSWIKLFKHMDNERTGRITYSEVAAMVREQLQFSPKELPSGALRAVWAALDTDSTGYINVGEFGAFMRRGEGEGPAEVDRIRGGRGELTRWKDRRGTLLKVASSSW